jgi:hypothetical protein
MADYSLNLLINIFLMAFAVFSVTELIYDKSLKGSFLHKIKNRGLLLILCALLSIGFNFYRDWKSDCKQEESNKAKAKVDSELQASQKEILKLQISFKDLIVQKVESTYTNSIKASNDALAKYNLKVTDSMHAVVSRLKLNAINPQLLIAPLEVGKQSAFLNKERNKFNIQFISKGGTSYHILLHCYLILEQTRYAYAVLNSYPLTFGESFLAEEITSTKELDLSPDIVDRPEVIVLLTGSFSKDPDGKIIVPYNEAFKYNFKENKYLTGLEMEYDKLKKSLNIK